MSLEIRGGVPRVQRIAVAGDTYVPFPSIIKYLRIANQGAQALRVFFTKADLDAAPQVDYVTVAATSGVWEGPVEASGIWLDVASGSTTAEVVSFQRRG